jgi:uncharacterized protein (TIGR03437 family)
VECPTFDTDNTDVGFIQGVRYVLIRSTSASCSWTVTSSAPWLKIVSAASGTGNGKIQFSTEANGTLDRRVGTLFLDNGRRHFVNQDGSGNSLALSPLAAAACGNQLPQFGASWVSKENVEIRIGTPDGQLFGQFGPYGSALLPPLADATGIYMNSRATTQTLASARISVRGNCDTAAILAQGILNAASFAPISLAPGALATVRGTKLAAAAVQASGPQYPAALGGISVLISGVACPLLYVSPTQINFLVPDDLPPGRHLLTIGDAASDVIIANISPGLFTLNATGAGVPLASLVAVKRDGSATNLAPYRCDINGCGAAPIALPEGTTDLYIVMYGTGLRKATKVTASLGQSPALVQYVGAQPQYAGLDQVNLLVQNIAALRGKQLLTLTVDDILSNTVELLFP